MPLNFESFAEVVSTSPSYRDLRRLADDKTVLKNPHKGWYYHYVDNSLTNPNYRQRVEKGKPFATPGMNHVYLRFDWGDIEYAGEGILDWSAIDEIMEERGALGYTFSLRICTFESFVSYATPKWVFDAGAKCTFINDKPCEEKCIDRCEPDYGDPIFLEKLENFLMRCAEKFDNDPRIEYIDIGTMGTWGEGHTFGGSNKVFSPEVLKKHVDVHLRCFKNKILVLNDDYFGHALKTGAEYASDLYDYCLGKGLGLRDDSICVDGYVKNYGYNTMRFPTLFAKFAENAPVDIELAHVSHQTDERFKGGFPVIEALRTAKATYAGFHGYEDEWNGKCPYISEYIANRLGYWFFIEGIDPGTPSSGATEMARVYIRNGGYARCYNQYDLKLRLRSEDGSTYPLNDKYPDSTRWEADTLSTERLRLDYRRVPRGEYSLEIGLFFGDEPIKLALKESTKSTDGFYTLSKIEVKPL